MPDDRERVDAIFATLMSILKPHKGIEQHAYDAAEPQAALQRNNAQAFISPEPRSAGPLVADCQSWAGRAR